MRRNSLLFILPLSLLLTGFDSCNGPTLPPTTDGGGFIIETVYIDQTVIVVAPGTSISATWKEDQAGAAGDASDWTVKTNSLALGTVQNGRVPATWDATWGSSDFPPAQDCAGIHVTLKPSVKGALEEVACILQEVAGGPPIITDDPNPIGIEPASINPVNPPQSFTITGSGFSSANGMPVVQYFDLQGNLVVQQAVDSVSSDGTTLVSTTPGLSQLPAGVYAGVVNNVAPDGSYQFLGTGTVEVTAPIYRPTAYTDASSSDPTYNPINNPTGPLSGDIAYSRPDSAGIVSWDYWDTDQSGQLNEITIKPGAGSWSAFPSITFPNNMTLYVPYTIVTTGPSGSGGYYVVTATVNGSVTSLYSSYATNTSGLLSMPIPAGTNLSSIQVAVSATPQDNPPGNPQTIDDIISFDIYVSQ